MYPYVQLDLQSEINVTKMSYELPPEKSRVVVAGFERYVSIELPPVMPFHLKIIRKKYNFGARTI